MRPGFCARHCAAAVASGLGDDADGAGELDPLGGGHHEAVEAGLGFKRVELHTVKRRVVEALPQAEELDGVAVAHPVLDGEARVVGVAVAGDVGQRDELVAVVLGVDSHLDALHMQLVALDLSHDEVCWFLLYSFYSYRAFRHPPKGRLEPPPGDAVTSSTSTKPGRSVAERFSLFPSQPLETMLGVIPVVVGPCDQAPTLPNIVLILYVSFH